ncbi:MAG: VF530 family DNA-binding protein [Lysobacterales bacterium]
MSADINYQNNPLHGVSLKQMLVEVVDQYGFDLLFAYLNINCFKTNPSIESSVKFLKKTTWAREMVESFYLYQYKNLPRASDEQFALSPRDRIVPADQSPGEPAQLSLEAAERLAEKRLRKSAERSQASADRSGTERHRASPRGGRSTGHRSSGNFGTDETDRSAAPAPSVTGPVDPWAKWRK